MMNKKQTDDSKTQKFKQDIQLNAAIDQFNDNLGQFIKTCEFLAQEKKIKYDAYIKAGFTSEQALEFVL